MLVSANPHLRMALAYTVSLNRGASHDQGFVSYHVQLSKGFRMFSVCFRANLPEVKIRPSEVWNGIKRELLSLVLQMAFTNLASNLTTPGGHCTPICLLYLVKPHAISCEKDVVPQNSVGPLSRAV